MDPEHREHKQRFLFMEMGFALAVAEVGGSASGSWAKHREDTISEQLACYLTG